jgi:hypothetical protein
MKHAFNILALLCTQVVSLFVLYCSFELYFETRRVESFAIVLFYVSGWIYFASKYTPALLRWASWPDWDSEERLVHLVAFLGGIALLVWGFLSGGALVGV